MVFPNFLDFFPTFLLRTRVPFHSDRLYYAILHSKQLYTRLRLLAVARLALPLLVYYLQDAVIQVDFQPTSPTRNRRVPVPEFDVIFTTC